MTADPDQSPDIFSWRAHPLREQAWRALGAVVVIAALSVGVYLLLQDRLVTVIAVLLLIASLNRFFFPSRFAIDAEGITARYPMRTQRCLWKQLRRFVHDKHGAYLSTRARASRLDAYRGMHVLFGTQRDAVIARIRTAMCQGPSEGGEHCPG